MPTIHKNDGLFTVGYITGPRHVWLGIRFSDHPVANPEIIKRPAVGKCHHGELDPVRIVQAAVAGSNGTSMYPARVEYVENDSPAYDLYEHCARLLAERAADEGSAQ